MLLTLLLALAQTPQVPALTDSLDLVITGARIVDGSGRPGFAGDVGVQFGKITDVVKPGALRNRPARVRIDAKGLVVAPGFIDVHSHTVDAILAPERKLNEGVIRQGVTTVVGGPDGGFDPARMKRVIDALWSQGAGTNVALYVGHNGVRRAVMGNAQQAPDADQLEKMKALVREGMELGAVGLSSGPMYEPGMFSKTDELIELAKVVAPYHGIYDSHVRDPVKRLIWSDQECLEVGEKAGVAPKIAHEKAVGLENEGKIHEVIAMVNAARMRGIDAVTDQYPYDGAATARLDRIIVLPKDLRGREGFDLHAALRDPALRARIKESSENGVDGGFSWLKAVGYSSMRITNSPDEPKLVGEYLSLMAERRKMDPFDLVAELILGAKRPIEITLGAIKESDVRALLVQPWNMIASDGDYVDSKTERAGHPRSTGTFARVLGHYVREAKVLTLEEAVRKMTSLPADWIGLRDRGRVAEGQAADLVIFDPRTIADRSTWEKPALMAAGVRDVFVNGVAVLRDEALTGKAPGRYLRARR